MKPDVSGWLLADEIADRSPWRLNLLQTDSVRNLPVDEDPERSRPIFIAGYMHTGTTLTQQVLGRHDQVFTGGGETRHFSHLSVIKRKYPDLNDDEVLADYVAYLLQVICTGYSRVNLDNTDQDPLQVIASCGLTSEDVEALLSEARLNRDHAVLMGTAYDYLTAKAGKERWLDKSPGYVMVLDSILELFPESKVIVLVRDPRDILASKLRRSQKQGNYDPLWDTISWRAAVRAGDNARSKYPDRIIRVRYEDLVSDPQHEFRRITEFLDLEYDDKMLSVDWVNTATVGVSGPGIGTSAIGKWRKSLPESDVFVCQQLAKEEMVRNGYQLEDLPPTVRLKSPIIIGRSTGDFVARLYKKWTEGGVDHLLNGVDGYRLRFKALKKTRDN